jgi:hypothetical protein
VTAAQTSPGIGTVHVHWAGPTAPTGLPLSGYYVERLLGPTPSPACGSSPHALLAASLSDCNDPNIATGSYDYRVTAVYRTLTAASAPGTVTVDATPPTVTIATAAGQPDPTDVTPVQFIVTFSEPVAGFDDADLILGGTASGLTAIVSPGVSPNTFDVAVSATGDGTITANVKSAAAADLAGNPSTAPAGAASVVYVTTPPVVTAG